ncbi:transcriptional regulator NrdR [Miniphocaeibacter halophilus]|uniref:Transcriptional repressor NrdR n=1 Tax=Miniphocaeibacter halophilus TaxID=2931922 RepID=A0AC61MRK5_9FIRM|nr:transcriptional regulator NrdR [Miniphocaeibacter halophilus]QQK07514.1 transcriptional repressor NrdR [Miniphocaeibacter halophilus]
MRCPFCDSTNTKVVDSRQVESETSIRRRRECLSCNKRFTTYEKYENNSLIVIKKNQEREAFDRNKILNGMVRSCYKRKVPMEDLEKATKEIELEINHLNLKEVPSSLIGEIIMEKLKKIDKVAYVRFASVYKEFQDVNSFYDEIEKVK